MHLQKTLKRDVLVEGIGLHTGVRTSVRLVPAPEDSGVVLWRKDRNVFINADAASVVDTAFATTLCSNGTRVKTVEHLLAAMAGLGIDNLLIEVNGPEIPIMDGSASAFVDLMLEAGLKVQSSPRQFIRVTKPVALREGNSEIRVVPYDGTLISYQIQYKHSLLGNQKMSINLDEQSFVKELAPARTFGFLKDVELMRANGLAKGGSLENAVIFSETSVMNEGGLRFEDECIRHKVLDLVGDLSLAGFPILGHITAVRTGHSTNVKFVRALLSSTNCWEIAPYGAESQAHLASLSLQPNAV